MDESQPLEFEVNTKIPPEQLMQIALMVVVVGTFLMLANRMLKSRSYG